LLTELLIVVAILGAPLQSKCNSVWHSFRSQKTPERVRREPPSSVRESHIDIICNWLGGKQIFIPGHGRELRQQPQAVKSLMPLAFTKTNATIRLIETHWPNLEFVRIAVGLHLLAVNIWGTNWDG